MFFLLYKRTDDSDFDDFPKISDHFPKIHEDCRRLSRKTRRCFDDTPTDLSTI